MSSNYPPGVSGGEFEIEGPDWERDIDDENCPQCHEVGTLVELGYHGTRWIVCGYCDYTRELESNHPVYGDEE